MQTSFYRYSKLNIDVEILCSQYVMMLAVFVRNAILGYLSAVFDDDATDALCCLWTVVERPNGGRVAVIIMVRTEL